MNASARLTAAVLGALLRFSPADGGGSLPPEVSAKKVAASFKEAIDWHRARGTVTPEDFKALEGDARRRAFTIANVAQLDVIVDVHQSIERALANGTTFADWKKEIGPQLEQAWQGSVDNPAWRLETIFRNATQTAYNNGRFEQASSDEAIASRPYWRFDGIKDARECPICRSCNGVIRPAKDPWWRTHLGPLHHCCRCTFTTLTEQQAERLKPTTDEALADTKPPAEGFGTPLKDSNWAEQAIDDRAETAPAEAAEAKKKQAVEDARAAAEVPGEDAPPSTAPATPPNTPPGGDGNGGGELGDKKPKFEPVGAPVSKMLEIPENDAITPHVVEATKAIGSLIGVPKMGPIPVEGVNRGNAGMYWFNPRTGTPTKIELLRKQSTPKLRSTHEIGHYIDHQGLFAPGAFASLFDENARAIAEKLDQTDAANRFRKTREKSFVWIGEGRFREKFKITPAVKHDIDDYWLLKEELFGRAFAQWVTVRSGNEELLKELAIARARPIEPHMPEYWSDEEFKEFLDLFDALFEGKGWMRRLP